METIIPYITNYTVFLYYCLLSGKAYCPRILYPTNHFLPDLINDLPKDQNEDILPKILYKYRSWEDPNHTKIIKEQRLYFPAVNQLNDPAEGRTIPRYDLEPFGTLKKAIERILRRDNPEMSEKELKIAAYKGAKAAKGGNPEYLNTFQKITYQTNCTMGGIFSCSSTSKDYHMWSLYADGHRGFIVGIDTFKLQEHILNVFTKCEIVPVWLKVTYVSKIPDVLPLKLEEFKYFSEIYSYKLDVFTHESEYRCFLFNFPNTSIRVPKDVISSQCCPK